MAVRLKVLDWSDEIDGGWGRLPATYRQHGAIVTLRRRLFWWPTAHLTLGRTMWVGHPRGSTPPAPRRIPRDAILLGRGWRHRHWITPGLVHHELTHTYWQLILGLLRWLWAYSAVSDFRRDEEAKGEAAETSAYPTYEVVP